jgi:hypothetical protein
MNETHALDMPTGTVLFAKSTHLNGKRGLSEKLGITVLLSQ